MVALSEMIAWRDKLEEARMSGVREVRDQNGEAITYRSDSEMAAALAAANRTIALAGAAPPNTIRFHTSKGL